MTRDQFREWIEAGDAKANEAVATLVDPHANEWLCPRCGWVPGSQVTFDECHEACGMEVSAETPPYATCRDADPRSWRLFGEMFDALESAVGACCPVYEAHSPKRGQRAVLWVQALSSTESEVRSVEAPARCAAAAEALLDAMGRFEEEPT